MPVMRLTGKVAQVTGDASGIGAAIARWFDAEGAIVTATDITSGTSRELAHLDVRDEPGWIALVAKVLARHGRIDVLVNNAGIVRPGHIELATLDDFRLQLDVMLTGTFLGCKEVIPAMARGGGGSLIAMASTGGLKGIGAIPAYSAAKGGVMALTRSIAAHCLGAGYAIRANAIAPGGIETPMLSQFSLGSANAPAPMRGQPEDVADLAVFLASDEIRHITGAVITVDGGASAT